MSIDYSGFAFGKGQPRVLSRHRKRVEADADLEAAYRDVDARSAGYSEISGRYTQAGSPDARVRREHHHLKGRNVKPEWRTDPRRILLVTAEEHQLIHSGALQVEGLDAVKGVRAHWNREMVPPGKEPFRLKSRRWSQQERD